MSATKRSPGRCVHVFGLGVQRAEHPQGEQRRFVVQSVQQVCWWHKCAAVLHFDPVVHRREHACTFLSECVSHSIAHQNLGCHRKRVEIVRGDVGFAPRNLDRSLMSRQSLLQSCPKCDVCASFRAPCELVSCQNTHTCNRSGCGWAQQTFQPRR